MTVWLASMWMLCVISVSGLIVYPPQSTQQNEQLACSGLLWWASMTQHKKIIITRGKNWANRSQSAESGVTHHYCKRTGTRPIHPAGCPGSLLCPHRCLRPAGTWAGSRSFSLGCPGCPSRLTSEPGGSGCWRWVTVNFPRWQKDGWPTNPLVCYSTRQNKSNVCYPMNLMNGGPPAWSPCLPGNFNSLPNCVSGWKFSD